MQTIEKTLPIDLQDGFFLDSDQARQTGESLADSYRVAEPFPHIVIDHFLPEAMIETILANFPLEATANEKVYERGYRGQNKRQISPNACNGVMRSAFAFFNSAGMLQFLEKLTGVNGLIADPYFTGGGLHETSAGGMLGVHSDFRINRQLHLERRLNAIIYLNKDWKEAYGGHLEIWDKEMKHCLKKILPVFNRCVVFNTDEHSNHGHPDPLTPPPGVSRKSVALYYYTASQKIHDDIKVRRTLYKRRPGDKIEWQKVLGGLFRSKEEK